MKNSHKTKSNKAGKVKVRLKRNPMQKQSVSHCEIAVKSCKANKNFSNHNITRKAESADSGVTFTAQSIQLIMSWCTTVIGIQDYNTAKNDSRSRGLVYTRYRKIPAIIKNLKTYLSQSEIRKIKNCNE